MKYMSRYRLLIVIYGLALVPAFYELGFLQRPAATVAGLAQPSPAADVLIDLYPDSLMAKCLEADRVMFLNYDLATARRLLEDALRNGCKEEETYFYNYATILMLMNEREECDESSFLNVHLGGKVLPKRLWLTIPRRKSPVKSDRKWSKIEEAVAHWRLHDLSTNDQLDPRVAYKDLKFPAPMAPDTVYCMAMSRDSKRIVVGRQDRVLRVFDTAFRRFSAIPEAHTGLISAVAMAANDTRAVSASLSGDLAVWDMANGKLIHRLLGHRNDVYGLAVFPDGIRCAAADRDGMVRIWDLEEGKSLVEFAAAEQPVSSVAVSADGSLLATGSWSGEIRLWSLQADQPRELQRLQGHRGLVSRLVFTPDSKRLVSCSRDKTARIW
ncbi:MAG TPA: WD40 repeat domain-containing protein, partial [Planctomycetes bacterium]|nr:WD40 repeat domain-containing protein [Planctomycetota bacterium]